jgi:hypothetical protein
MVYSYLSKTFAEDIMSTQKPLEVTTILDSINAQKEKYFKQMCICNKVIPILREFHGKKITKRIETAVVKAMPEYTIYFGHKYSWWELKIWGNGLSYDESVSLNLGYYDTFTNEEFDRCSPCMYGEWYNNLNIYTDHPELLQTMVDKYNELKVTLANFNSMIPKEYPIYQFFKF